MENSKNTLHSVCRMFTLLFGLGINISTAQTSLVGMTQNGGTGPGINGAGTSFNIDVTTGTYNSSSFMPSSTGVNPNGSYFKASNGNLYGLVKQTSSGFITGNGYMVQYNPSTGAITPLFQFTGSSGAYMGSKPYGSLIEANPGILYGTTYLGGSSNQGVIFSYNLSTSTYSVLYEFSTTSSGGVKPRGDLFKASNGLLYGMTSQGGTTDNGVLFSFNLTGNTYTELFSFSGTTGSYLGTAPEGSVIEPSPGILYGMAPYGGINDEGVLFSFNITGAVYTVKYNFDSSLGAGANPEGSLLTATNGKLYGLSSFGGLNGVGTLFEFNTMGAGTYSTLIDFSGPSSPNEGSFPYGSLMQASNAKLYGMTFGDGSSGNGLVFSYDLVSATYSVIVNFSGTTGTTLGGKPTNGRLIEVTGVCAYPSVTSSQATDVNCNGGNDGSATVTAISSGAITYNWLPSGGTANSASNLAAGIYTCAITNVCGTVNETITVNEPQVLTVSISASNQTVCLGNSTSLSPNVNGGTGLVTYTWTGGSNGVIFTPNPSVTTTYTLGIEDMNGCTATDSVVITVNSLPNVTAVSNTSILCPGQTASLTAGGATSYTWSTGSNNTVIAVTPSVNTTYTVTGTAANGCTNTAVVTQSASLCTNVSATSKNDSGLNFYPNPFSGKFFVEGNIQGEINVSVYNTLGKLVYSQQLKENKTEIDLSNQPAGIYFIKTGTLTQKLIKQ